MKTIMGTILLMILMVPALWAQSAGGDPLNSSRVNIHLSQDLNSRELVMAGVSATETTLQAVIYKFDDPKLLPVFLEAIERGVAVQVLADASEAAKKKSLVGKLKAAGAEVRLWPGGQGKLHAKFMICDENRVLTGSWNLTKSAGKNNVEILMDFPATETETIARFSELFDKLWNQAKK